MSKPRVKTLFSILLLVISAAVQAQQSAASHTFDQEPYVVERLASKYVFHADGTGMRESEVRVRVQSQAGVQAWGIIPISYDRATEEVGFDYVRVRKPDGTVITTPASDVQDIDTEVSRVAPMYSDARQKHAAVKGLTPGDTLEYQVVVKVFKPVIDGQFWTNYYFDVDGIVLQESLEVHVPEGKYVNVKSASGKPTVTQENGEKVYRWTTSNLRRKTDEEKAKESKKEKLKPSVQLTTFQSWDEIGKWYSALERSQVQPSTVIQAKAAELTKGAKSDTDKLRAIYKFVAQDFRYIGLEFGTGRYQPHAADDVMKNGYGDCKDKHTLLASLAQAAGITVSPVLINSTRAVDEDVPSPGQFDHVISLATVDAKTVWLDTTPEVAPFGMLLWTLRDKTALVATGKPEWKKTPLDSPMESYYEFTAEGKLSASGELEAKITRKLRGDGEVQLRAAFRAVGEPEWRELLQRVSYGTGFAGTVSDPEVSSVKNTDEPFVITYTYKRPDYGDWPNHRILAFGPMVPLFPVDDQDKSNDPINLGGPFRLTSHARIELPQGYKPILPEDVNLSNEFVGYRAHYEYHDGWLTMDRELKLKAREMPSSFRAGYKQFVKNVGDDELQYIVLTGGTADTVADAASAVGKTLGLPSETASGLYERGRTQMQAHDVSGAMKSFQRASEIDPKFPGVWTAIGFTQLVQGHTDEALKALHKEVENHPEDPTANKALAQALFAMRRLDEATAAMRAYVKLAPNDTDAVTGLAGTYLQQAKYQEAAEVLEGAVKQHADNAVLQRQLGNAYAKLGKSDLAVAAMHKSIDLQPDDPTAINDAAYELADAGIDLDEAEQLSRKAVKAESEKTLNVTLNNLQVEDLRRVSRLAAFWDTLGWVYFRRGDLAKAEEYLKPAWSLSQAPTIGDHLAQVYEKEGKKLIAAKTYAQSANTGSSIGPAAMDKYNEIRKHVDKLAGEGTGSTLWGKAGEELSLARTIRLPNIGKGVGSGEFFLLLGADKKVRAKFVTGETSLKAAAPALQTAATGKLVQEQPGGEPVAVVRRAVVICHQTPAYCELVLMTPDSVKSVN